MPVRKNGKVYAGPVIPKNIRSDDKSEISKYETWKTFKNVQSQSPNFKMDKVIFAEDFSAYAEWLKNSGYGSSLQYVNAAIRYERGAPGLGLMASYDWEPRLEIVRNKCKKQDNEIEQANPFVIIKQENNMLMRARILALITGVRPIGLENCTAPTAVKDGKGNTVALTFWIEKDKVSPHFAIAPCTCPKSPQFCIPHVLGVPQLPIAKARLKMLTPEEYTLYCYRRLHILAVATLNGGFAKLMKDAAVRERINQNLGWCDNSKTFTRYAKDFRAHKIAELDVFKPVLDFYLTGKVKGVKVF